MTTYSKFCENNLEAKNNHVCESCPNKDSPVMKIAVKGFLVKKEVKRLLAERTTYKEKMKKENTKLKYLMAINIGLIILNIVVHQTKLFQ